jgi:hypothetical protein
MAIEEQSIECNSRFESPDHTMSPLHEELKKVIRNMSPSKSIASQNFA